MEGHADRLVHERRRLDRFGLFDGLAARRAVRHGQLGLLQLHRGRLDHKLLGRIEDVGAHARRDEKVLFLRRRFDVQQACGIVPQPGETVAEFVLHHISPHGCRREVRREQDSDTGHRHGGDSGSLEIAGCCGGHTGGDHGGGDGGKEACRCRFSGEATLVGPAIVGIHAVPDLSVFRVQAESVEVEGPFPNGLGQAGGLGTAGQAVRRYMILGGHQGGIPLGMIGGIHGFVSARGGRPEVQEDGAVQSPSRNDRHEEEVPLVRVGKRVAVGHRGLASLGLGAGFGLDRELTEARAHAGRLVQFDGPSQGAAPGRAEFDGPGLLPHGRFFDALGECGPAAAEVEEVGFEIGLFPDGAGAVHGHVDRFQLFRGVAEVIQRVAVGRQATGLEVLGPIGQFTDLVELVQVVEDEPAGIDFLEFIFRQHPRPGGDLVVVEPHRIQGDVVAEELIPGAHPVVAVYGVLEDPDLRGG